MPIVSQEEVHRFRIGTGTMHILLVPARCHDLKMMSKLAIGHSARRSCPPDSSFSSPAVP